jgi:hypothetical protein
MPSLIWRMAAAHKGGRQASIDAIDPRLSRYYSARGGTMKPFSAGGAIIPKQSA